MRKIEAVIQPHKFEAVKEALKSRLFSARCSLPRRKVIDSRLVRRSVLFCITADPRRIVCEPSEGSGKSGPALRCRYNAGADSSSLNRFRRGRAAISGPGF
jgi:hypothetical protein